MIKEKLAQEKFLKLKEITTIMELALWKMRMNENSYQIKKENDESSLRRQCCITCGADVIIRHVLPYLITVGDEESDSDMRRERDEGSF